MHVGESGVGVRNLTTNVRIGCMRAGLKFGLEPESWRWSYTSDKTHIENMKNPVQVQLPGTDCLAVALLAKMSRDRISFTALDNMPLDLGHSPTVESLVRKPSRKAVAGSTCIVNCSIALRTDWLS